MSSLAGVKKKFQKLFRLVKTVHGKDRKNCAENEKERKVIKEKETKSEPEAEASNLPYKPTDIVKPCLKTFTEENELHEKNQTLNSCKKKPPKEEDIIEIACNVKRVENEMNLASEELKHVEEENSQMMMIVEEFEKTFSQLLVEKERENVRQQLVMERIVSERDEVVRDHKNVEQAFADLNNKYERAKEVVVGQQFSEDNLKGHVDELTSRYSAGEKKYEDTRRVAEDQLSMAGETLADVRKVKGKDIARLTAGLRKAEMQVSSLEEQIDQKTQENKELAKMCEDLLEKFEKAS